jgi:hypothetical protein
VRWGTCRRTWAVLRGRSRDAPRHKGLVCSVQATPEAGGWQARLATPEAGLVRIGLMPACTCTRARGRVWNNASKADPRRQQDWILKCLQGGRARPLEACGVATLSTALQETEALIGFDYTRRGVHCPQAIYALSSLWVTVMGVSVKFASAAGTPVLAIILARTTLGIVLALSACALQRVNPLGTQRKVCVCV